MTQIVPMQQYRIYLDKWDMWLTVVATPEGIFYVLRELCEALGIKDVQQRARAITSTESVSGIHQEMACPI